MDDTERRAQMTSVHRLFRTLRKLGLMKKMESTGPVWDFIERMVGHVE